MFGKKNKITKMDRDARTKSRHVTRHPPFHRRRCHVRCSGGTPSGDDPHPIKPSDEDEDYWVAQARRGNLLLDSTGFSAVIGATNGTTARMNTVHPATFVAFKRCTTAQADRNALKRRRDLLQADAVQALLEQ